MAVLDRATGQLGVGEHGHTRYELASVVKVVTAVDVLHRGEAGQATVDRDTSDTIRRALSDSDDAAMNTLWQDYGGESTVQDMIALAHLSDVSLPADPNNWGETEMSAVDVTAVYQYALAALDPDDRALVLSALTHASPTAADGTDQTFGLWPGSPSEPAVAVKQGWQYDDATQALFAHSTGLVDNARYAVAVLTQQPEDRSYATAFVHLTTESRAATTALATG